MSVLFKYHMHHPLAKSSQNNLLFVVSALNPNHVLSLSRRLRLTQVSAYARVFSRKNIVMRRNVDRGDEREKLLKSKKEVVLNGLLNKMRRFDDVRLCLLHRCVNVPTCILSLINQRSCRV
jgi:hypothetical protein